MNGGHGGGRRAANFESPPAQPAGEGRHRWSSLAGSVALVVAGMVAGVAVDRARRRQPAPPPVGQDRPSPPAPTPVPEPPPADTTRRRGPRIAATIALVGLIAAAVAVSVWLPAQDESAISGSTSTSTSEAAAWDAEVAELAAFVEEARGAAFVEAVPVELVEEDDFDAQVDDLGGDLSDVTEERPVRLLRALAVMQGELDMRAANAELDDSTSGYYDPIRERITVRGDELTTETRLTIVHELTHALQHQQHPRLFARRSFGTDALLEGDAIRIEYEYIDSLDPDDADELFQGFEGSIPDVPDSLVAFLDAPYVLGDSFVYYLDSVGGDAVDEAFDRPPATEEQVMNPALQLEPDPPQTFAPPPPAGSTVIQRGEIGALGWLVTLAERIEPFVALDAVDGWRGDAYTLYETGGRTCAVVTVAGDTTADANQLNSALLAWAREVTAVAPVVTRTNGGVSLRVCDPGPDASLALTGDGGRALVIPATRTFMAADEIAAGASAEDAACVAENLIRRYSLDELESPDPPVDADERRNAAAEACEVI